MTSFTESEIEIFALNELNRLGFSLSEKSDRSDWSDRSDRSDFSNRSDKIFRVAEARAPYGEMEKRASYSDVVLRHTLEQAINRLNSALPETAQHEALKAVRLS